MIQRRLRRPKKQLRSEEDEERLRRPRKWRLKKPKSCEVRRPKRQEVEETGRDRRARSRWIQYVEETEEDRSR
jgi:hypothetical protein